MTLSALLRRPTWSVPARLLVAGGVLGAVTAGCGSAGNAAPGTPPAAEAPAEAAAEETGPGPWMSNPAAPQVELEPEDGVWYRDEESGRRYYLARVPKIEGQYRWIDDRRIRLPRGLFFEVVEDAEDHFLVKMFVVDSPATVAAEPAPGWAEGAAERPEPPPIEADRLVARPFGAGLPDSGQWRNGFQMADMNGDGHLDLVHGPPRKGRAVPHVFLGDGAGNWRLWDRVRVPEGLRLDYGDVAVADFDQDGVPDLALGVHLRGLTVLVHDGDGGFTRWDRGLDFRQPEKSEGLPPFSSRAVAATDWDGDGRPDLVALSEGPGASLQASDADFRNSNAAVAVFLNQGDGSWRQLMVDDAVRVMGDALAVGDLDGDGRADFLTGTSIVGLTRLVGYGEGAAGYRQLELPDLPEWAFVTAVAVHDLDGDGAAEALLAYTRAEGADWYTGVDVYRRGEAPRTWVRRNVLEAEGRMGVHALAPGDADGDGHTDLLLLTGDGEVWLMLADGDGGFVRESLPAIEGGQGCRGYHAALVDLDGEPGDEAVLAFAGEPGGELMLGLLSRCASRGHLGAYKLVPKSSGHGG